MRVLQKSRYLDVRNLVLRTGRSSGSFVARSLGIGFNEAMTYLDWLEQDGVIATADEEGRRAILRPVHPPV